MRTLTSISLLFTSISLCFSQEASMVWYESFGGEGNDIVEEVITDLDNNVYILGTIEMANEDGSPQHDLFIAKYTEGGLLEWKHELSGEGNDQGVSIKLNGNGNIHVLVSSDSKTGYFSQNKGYEDLYLFNLSNDGELISHRQFGGEFIDLPSSILITNDGNLLISGHSRSTTGSYTNNRGQLDFWVIKTDLFGNTIWERTYGGSDEDYTVDLLELSDGNYMLLGHSTSIDFDIPDNYGDLDISLMKLDQNGEIIWQESYGGFYNDIASDMIELGNGNIMIGGSTFSNNIDISFNNGNSDGWIFEVDQAGDIVWENTYGADGNDYIQSLELENGVVKVLGNSFSETIQDKVNNGAEDIWFFKLAPDHTILTQHLIGGDSFENASSFILLSSNELLITGRSNSGDAFGNGNGNDYDGFIAKIRLGEFNEITAQNKLSVHPNPSNGIFYLNNLTGDVQLKLFNAMGQEIPLAQPFDRVSTYVINLEGHESGVYLLEVIENGQKEISRLIKK
ncbi:MAG: T9SS type A sorting domain-containing protein [Crocinitomicaceae bacterium]